MATTQANLSVESPYPSFRELRGNHEHVRISPAAMRLYWPLESGPLSLISVMKDKRNASELEPFFQLDVNDSTNGVWHEISSLPLTEPKVSSVEVSSRDLDVWEPNWAEYHSYHTETEFRPGPEYITYGDLSNEDRPYAKEQKEDGSWEEDSDTDFLISCCGEERPLRKRGFKLNVTPAVGNDFVTIRDYVSAVHPWFISLQEDIKKAMAVSDPWGSSVGPDTEFMVEILHAPEHKMMPKEIWMQSH